MKTVSASKVKKELKPMIESIDLDEKEMLRCGEYLLTVNIEELRFKYTLPNLKRDLVLVIQGTVIVRKFVTYCNVYEEDLELGIYWNGEEQETDFTKEDFLELLTDYVNDNLELF